MVQRVLVLLLTGVFALVLTGCPEQPPPATQYTLTVTNGGGGTVTSSPAGIDCGSDCSQAYGDGTQITLTASPDTGYSVDGWSGACTGTGSCSLTMSAAQTVGATFARPSPGLVVGTVSGNTASVNSVAEFTARLANQPASDVTFPVASSDESEGIATPALLTFTPEDWFQGTTVQITGTNPDVVDGTQSYSILLGPASSADPVYDGFDPDDVPIEGIVLRLGPPEPVTDAVSGLLIALTPQVHYTGEKPLAFSLVSGPVGMAVDNETGEVTWIPPAQVEGTSAAVTVGATDGTLVAETAFAIQVAHTQPLQTELLGEVLTVIDPRTDLSGLSLTALGAGASAAGLAVAVADSLEQVTIEEIPPVSVPAYPDYLIPLTPAFAVKNGFTGEVEVRMPLDALPAGTKVENVRLYTYGTAVDAPVPFWGSVLIDIGAEGSRENPVLVVRLAAISGIFVFAVPSPEPEAGTEPTALEASTKTLAQRAGAGATAIEDVTCVPQSWFFDLITDYGDQDCTVTSDPDVKITVLDFGSSADATRWGGTTIEELVTWLVDARAAFDGLGMSGYDDEFKVQIEPLDGCEFGSVREEEGYQTLHLHADPAATCEIAEGIDASILKISMQGTVAHEYFHQAQLRPGKISPGAERSWLLEGTADWFGDYAFDDLNAYRYAPGSRILEVGLNAKPSAKDEYNEGDARKRSYERFSFFKLVAEKCGFSIFPSYEDISDFFILDDEVSDPTGIQNFQNELQFPTCDFGAHLGEDLRGSLEAAMVYYQFATQYRNDICLLDANELDGSECIDFNFDLADVGFGPFPRTVDEWLALDDPKRQLNGAPRSIPPAGAYSFFVYEVAGTLPSQSVARLSFDSEQDVVVSVAIRDISLQRSNRLGDLPHDWLRLPHENTYTYEFGGKVLGLFVTMVNPSTTETADVDVWFSVVGAGSSSLNDTGITFCGEADSGNNDPCVGTEPEGQDAHYGRDAAALAGTLTKVGGGSEGFDFTKIANDGSELPASATLGTGPTDWACTRDNVTGLIWEVKAGDGGQRDKDWTYTWYDPSSPGGNPGTQDGGSCVGSDCDTASFVAAVNAQNLCGASDWRAPTVKELEGIADNGLFEPAIDIGYFPNTQNTTSWTFWSGSAYAGDSSKVWGVGFGDGGANYYPKSWAHPVRAVRSGQ